MSNLVETIRAKLLGASSVSALVDTRIYPLVAPQGAPAPRVVLTVISDVPENTTATPPADLLREARVQVDAYATTYAGAQALAEAIRLVLAAQTGTSLSALGLLGRDLYDDASGLYRVSNDYAVWR